MTGGRMAAQAVELALVTGNADAPTSARRRFMQTHGPVFWILGILQHFWYRSDSRRERFVAICRDVDVQRLTFDAYISKRLVRAMPFSHLRIFVANLAHLAGVVPA